MKKYIKSPRLYIIILVIVLLFYPFFVNVWNKNIYETTNTEFYLDNSYVNYTGGKEAQKFFDKYANANTYRDISFYFKDSGKVIGFYNYWTVFALDINYQEKEFFDVARKIVLDTNEPLLFEDEGYGFRQYVVIKNEPLYYNNYAVFYIDVDSYTIRYCFVYDCPHEKGTITDVRSIINRSINLEW